MTGLLFRQTASVLQVSETSPSMLRPWELNPQVVRRPRLLDIARIVLAKGSLSTPERRMFVERIVACYPQAEVVDQQRLAHNQIRFDECSPEKRVERGKRTLVFGEHRSAVRFSSEAGNTCPNYWHFSPTGFCHFGCRYCYLAGTPGVWHSPTIRVFLNLDEILSTINRVARGLARPTAFYLGKLQDGLALDPLTGFSQVVIPFFARHPYARQIVLTKTDEVDGLLGLDHGGRTILSWSLNPQEVIAVYEENTPSLDERILAMRRCAESGYPIRAVVMPLIPVPNWQTFYCDFIRRLLWEVPVARLTLGGICIYRQALQLLESKMGKGNAICANLVDDRSADGRRRFPWSLRQAMYAHLIQAAHEVDPGLEIALCLEEAQLWQAVGLRDNVGRCNCAL